MHVNVLAEWVIVAARPVTSEAENRTKTLAGASSLSNHLGIHASENIHTYLPILSAAFCSPFRFLPIHSDSFAGHFPNEYALEIARGNDASLLKLLVQFPAVTLQQTSNSFFFLFFLI